MTELLDLVRRLIPEGERIAAVLAARDEARVVDVLRDRPRLRTCVAPIAGKVVLVDGGLLICPSRKRPKGDDLADVRSPVGGWAGDAWFVPSPIEVLVKQGVSVDADQPCASTRCTLDQLGEVYGPIVVTRAIAGELELELDDARAIADVMTGYIEAFVDHSDAFKQINGVLVTGEAFGAGIADGTFVVGHARVLGLPAIAARQASPSTPPSRRDRWYARIGVTPPPIDGAHYLSVSEAALEARMLLGVRMPDEPPLTGWTIVATSEDVPNAEMGIFAIDELLALPSFAQHREAWELALALPVGWQFTMLDGGLVASSNDGRSVALDD